jgi:biopolymer transport protein ExbD
VKADNHVEYGSVVRAMVILQKAGAKKVGFITDPLPADKRRGR